MKCTGYTVLYTVRDNSLLSMYTLCQKYITNIFNKDKSSFLAVTTQFKIILNCKYCVNKLMNFRWLG